jgi:DNA-binding CsgD family transcriptional regulator
MALAGDDDEIAGVAIGTARGLASLLADDLDKGFVELREGVTRLRRQASPVALPPWFLFPIVATAFDLEGDGGDQARRDAGNSALRVASGFDATWHIADAVALGRRGDVAGANAACGEADRLFASLYSFEGYMHIARRLAVDAALADGWGQPADWLVAAERWASERNLPEFRAACAALGRRAGVPQKRRRRGAADVPAELASQGVTSREVDVLLLVADGLTNVEIAERLYLSPRTVKGYVENLLAKTGAGNRTQLAAFVPASPDA